MKREAVPTTWLWPVWTRQDRNIRKTYNLHLLKTGNREARMRRQGGRRTRLREGRLMAHCELDSLSLVTQQSGTSKAPFPVGYHR